MVVVNRETIGEFLEYHENNDELFIFNKGDVEYIKWVLEDYYNKPKEYYGGSNLIEAFEKFLPIYRDQKIDTILDEIS